MIKFGPSGNSDSFFEEGFSTTQQALDWVKNKGLDLYEYSFGHGYTMSSNTAKAIGDKSKEIGIEITVHAPYYINLANPDELSGQNSVNYIVKGVDYVKNMCGKKLVFHAGTQLKQDRNDAINLCKKRLDAVLEKLYQTNNSDVLICPETLGKYSQIGTYKEIIDICTIDKMLVPTLDFGHINCIMQGKIISKDDYRMIIDYMVDKLGDYKSNNFHIHFSKIQYSTKGEIKHLTFDDDVYGPNYEPLIELLTEYKLSPTIICESKSVMAENALEMKNYYKKILGGK